MADPFAQYVVKEDPFAAYVASGAPAPSVADVLSGRAGHDTNLSDSPDEQDWKAKLNDAMQSAAHPQSLGDLASLVIPSDAGALVGRSLGPAKQAIAKYGGAVVDVGTSLLPARARSALGVLRTLSPTEWHSPLTVAGREARGVAATRAFNDLPLAQQMDRLPMDAPGPLEGGRTADPRYQPQTPFHERPLAQQMDRLPATTGVIRTRTATPPMQPQTPFNERPLYQQMEQLPQTPAPMPAHGPEPPNLMLGRETATPTATAPPPQAVAPEGAGGLSAADRAALVKQGYPPEVVAKIEQQMAQQGMARPAVSHQPVATASEPPNPLAQPRIDVGAQRVGREAGMTTDEVRQAAGPVLDEARGEASPILPQQALNSIIDNMRKLAPGAEREAYVARATSGKSKWQVENIRRTLEHLGLIAPVAVSLREPLIRMMASHDQPSGTP